MDTSYFCDICVTIAANDYSEIVESKKTGKWYYHDDECTPTEIAKIDGEIVGFSYPGSEDGPYVDDYSVILDDGTTVQIEWIGGGDDWYKNVEAGIEDDPHYDRDLGLW